MHIGENGHVVGAMPAQSSRWESRNTTTEREKARVRGGQCWGNVRTIHSQPKRKKTIMMKCTCTCKGGVAEWGYDTYSILNPITNQPNVLSNCIFVTFIWLILIIALIV